MELWAWVSTPATVRSVRKMRSITLSTSSSKLGRASFIVSSALNWLGELRELSPASAHPN